MDRSLFSRPSSSKRSLRSEPDLELPRWENPMAASIIPPPIVQSTYALPSRTITQSIVVKNTTPLQERESELEADLQFLLDAQAEGLLHGLEGAPPDDQTSTGSTTPTIQSVRSASLGRRKTTLRKKTGLRSARKGIYNAIQALSAVKDEELEGVDQELREKERTLERIDEWQNKRQGLREAAKQIHSNEDTVRVQRLQQEADALQEQINNVELQLADMKTRHRKLMKQAMAVENSVQAKLASYTSSLRLLDEDVKRFLSGQSDTSSRASNPRDGLASLSQLPQKQRTLNAARDGCVEERDIGLQQRTRLEEEKVALDEGAAVWKDVVRDITTFERQLRAWTRSRFAASSKPDVVTPAHENQQEAQLNELLGKMSELIEALEVKLELVKTRRWNLLVAAIGAEVEALKQGKQILENVVQAANGQDHDGLVDARDTPSQDQHSVIEQDMRELDEGIQAATWDPARTQADSEDDPDPELLFSRQETDTE